MPLCPVKEDPDGPKRPRSSLFEDPSQDQNLTLTPVTEDPVVHDPDPTMPLSPIVVRLKRHRSSLFEDPSKVQNLTLTPVTEDPDVLKRPCSSLSSEDPDVQGGKHQDPDPVQPAKPLKPVSRTLKEILDESGPYMSKEQELEYAMLFAKWKEAEPITNRVMASIPEPLFGGRINVVQSYGPDTLAAMESLRRRRAEKPKYYGEAALNEYIERQKSTWGPCKICFKAGDHISLYCPYLEYVPEGASVGPGVELVCRNCGLPDQHPGAKRAILKSCFICASDHWGTDCPRAEQHKTVPYNPFPFSDR